MGFLPDGLIRRRYREEIDLLRSNRDAVAEINKQQFLAWLKILIFIFIILTGISILSSMSSLSYRVLLYSVALCSFCALFFLFRFIGNPTVILIGFYLLFEYLCLLTGILNIYINRTSTCSSSLVILCMVPVTILDRNGRIAAVSFMNAAVLAAASYLVKEYSVAVDDWINLFSFSLVGFFAGYHIRMKKLELFEIQRKTDIQRYYDFLTSLPNRRLLYNDLTGIYAANGPSPVRSVVMIDIDSFKEYNDAYGHVAGDECLKKLAACLSSFVRDRRMTFYRYGGEEFLGVSPLFSAVEAGEFCDLIRHAVYNLNIPHEKSPYGRLTVSFGLSETGMPGATGYTDLINMADIALYHAKNRGKDCFVIYEDGMAFPF